MKKKLLLLRHGEVGAEYHHRFIGSLDVRLAPTGRRQAIAIARLIRAWKPQRCFCSPLKRCVETAKAAVDSSRLKVELAPDLREVDFGRWEKMTFEEIQKSDPDAVNRWAKFDPDFSFPRGERLKSFVSRVEKIAKRLAACPEETLLAVTHGGVIRAMICHFLGVDPRQYVLFDVRPGSLTTMDLFDGKGVLTGLNQGIVTATTNSL